jgi:hypothetical protein
MLAAAPSNDMQSPAPVALTLASVRRERLVVNGGAVGVCGALPALGAETGAE